MDKSLEMSDLKEILNSLSDAVLVYNSNLEIVLVNEKVTEYEDVDTEQLIGTTPEQHLQKGIILNTIVRRALTSKQEVTGMIQARKGYYSSRCRPILDSQGDVKYIVSTASSLSEINELQQMLYEQVEKSERYLREVQQLRKALLTDEYIYASEDMGQLLDTIQRVAPIDCNVLITGESGVGKDIIAHTIHMNSPRKTGPYFPVNIPAIPENLLEAELFGYEAGAFTGAAKGGKVGLFEVAKGGTILLDEIGDMSYNLQVKILRAIESGEIMRLGATKAEKLDVRILAATNRDIKDAVKKGEFRSDLYYRLNVVTLHIKPLRERPDDIQPLCQYFLNQFNQKYEQRKKFSADAYTELKSYSWPGNVRELKNIVERLCILSADRCITESDVRRVIDMKGIEFLSSRISEEKQPPPVNKSIQSMYEEYEKDRILDALKRVKGNKTAAASLLGISRGKLYRILQSASEVQV